jgi:hypothetical protein
MVSLVSKSFLCVLQNQFRIPNVLQNSIHNPKCPANSVQDPKCPAVFKVKKCYISDNGYKHFDLGTKHTS